MHYWINHAFAKASCVCAVSVCGRAVAPQLAQSYQVSGGRAQVWRRWFQHCFAAAFFASRGAVHYLINHALAKASCVCVVGVCGRAVALQLAQSYHVSGVSLQVWRRWFQDCFASACFVPRAAVHYLINHSFAKALGVCADAQLRCNLACAIIPRAWGRLQVWLWRFQSCFTSAFFLSRAVVYYWMNLGLLTRRASVRSRSCFLPCRAQSRQGLVGRV